MRPARSLLLVPASRPDALDDGRAGAADVAVLDLSAPALGSERPRAVDAAGRIAGAPGRRWWLRADRAASDLPADVLATVLAAGPIEAVLIAGARSAGDVARAAAAVAGAAAKSGRAADAAGLVIELDNARAAFFAHELAAAPRVASLCFNGARHGELVCDLGCAWSIDGPELLHARQYALLAARAAAIACPLDGPFADAADQDGLVRDTELSRRLGYRGRIVIDPGQIEPVNRIYSPTREEIDYHRRVLDTLEAAVADGRASTTLDGKMIDTAHAATARAVIAQARALGVIP